MKQQKRDPSRGQDSLKDPGPEPGLKTDQLKRELRQQSYEEQLEALEPEGEGQTAPPDGNHLGPPTLERLPRPGELPEPGELLPLEEIDASPPEENLPELEEELPALRNETEGGEEGAPERAPESLQAEEEAIGLATTVSQARFVSAARGVETQWSELSPVGRADVLGDAAADELVAAGVPETGTVLKELPRTTNGEMNPAAWNIEMNEDRFARDAVSTDHVAKMADFVFHEARHGEQIHRIARVHAGRGLGADEIQSLMGVKAEIAADATSQPLRGDGLAAREGEAWSEAVYGAGLDNRRTVYRELREARAAYREKKEIYEDAVQLNNDCVAAYNLLDEELEQRDAAYVALYHENEALLSNPEQDPDRAQAVFDDLELQWQQIQLKKLDQQIMYNNWVQARELMRRARAEKTASRAGVSEAYQAYRALPEEVDAWAVGGQVRAAYLDV